MKLYNLAGDIKNPNKGWTIRSHQSASKVEKKELSPGPNEYTIKDLSPKKNAVIGKGNRSELYVKDHVNNPSPHNYVTSPEFFKRRKSLSFTKQPREMLKVGDGPGPGHYELQAKLSEQKGYMGRKTANASNTQTPGIGQYDPNFNAIKPKYQRVVSFDSNREDFSKSTTGQIGPGYYLTEGQAKAELGMMSKSLKFDKNRNTNVNR